MAMIASSRVSIEVHKKLWHEYVSGRGGVAQRYRVPSSHTTHRTVISVLAVGSGGFSDGGMPCRLGI